METAVQDLRYAVRVAWKNRRFSAVIVLTLGLAIGANTVIFSGVNALLLNPFGFRDVGRVVALMEDSEQCRRCDASPGTFTHLQERGTALAELAAYQWWTPNLSGPDAAEPLRAFRVTPGYHEVLGAETQLGRPFGADEADARSVVISHGFWQRRFGGDPGVVGTTVVLDGEPHTVVGVLRRSHEFPASAELWAPVAWTGADRANRHSRYLGVVGRLRPDISLAAAQAELSTLAQQLAQEHPESNRGWNVRAEHFTDWAVSGPRPYLLLLLGAVGFLLLIACTNVANLLFTQATARGREIAVRSALGATRGRIVRQLLAEGLVLALAAGVLGLLLASWGLALVSGTMPPDLAQNLPGWANLRIDRTALAFTLLISVGVGLVCGLAPALGLTRPGLTSALKEGGRGTTFGVRSGRSRHVLVVSQVALALMLLAGTGLMAQSFVRMMNAHPGFVAERVITSEVSLPRGTYDTGDRIAAFYQDLLQSVDEVPGVESAAIVNVLPMSRSGSNQYFNIEGRPALSVAEAPYAGYRVVSRDYLATMGIPLQRGRGFAAEDARDAAPVVMINEAFARRHFQGEDPVGQRLAFNGRSHEIVGVVGDVRHYGPREGALPEMFLHHPQVANRVMSLVVRTEGSPPLLVAGPVRGAVAELDRGVGVATMRSMEQLVDEFLAPERVTTGQMTVFALIALLIAALGIYGVMSHSVLQRAHEIGVRTALGARSSDVLRLVVRQGVRLTALGVALGLAGAVVLTRLMTSLLYDVSATHPPTLAAAATFLGLVALVACFVPARRAARVDPMIVLRSE
jgi:predicted permease